MALANSSSGEENARNLQRMLWVFACKQEYGLEKHNAGERPASSAGAGNETKQAPGQTMKGTRK